MARQSYQQRGSRADGADYVYCSVCRRNHDQGRKHIFSKQHKNKLATLLGKVSKKVKAARKMLHKPQVYEGELEPGATMWCYCCELEISRHVTDGLVSVEWGGLLEHMACPSHHKKTRHFWWEHGAEKSQLQNMLLFDAELQRFKEKVVDAMKQLEEARDTRIKEAAEKIKKVEQSRSQHIISEPLETVATASTSAYCHPYDTPGTLQSTAEWSRGYGEQCWNRSSSLPGPSTNCSLPSLEGPGKDAHTGRKRAIGNVHTGATPPWLRDEDEEEEVVNEVIGPSLEGFLKHKEMQSRARKNPKRVGADFHLKLKRSGQLDVDDEHWLPSFGRVWNYGPRSHSKTEFQKLLTTNPDLHHDSGPSTHTGAASCSSPQLIDAGTPQLPSTQTLGVERVDEQKDLPRILPYVRKRPCKQPRVDLHVQH